MAQIGRDPNKTRNELAAGESGSQAVGQAAGQLNQTYESGADNALKAASIFGGMAQQGVENKQRDRQLGEQERSNQMGEAMQQDRQDIEAADKGVQQQGPTRAEKLKQEMERGRLQAQMDKPMEIPGPGQHTYAQTEARKAEDQSKLTTARLNAQANFMNASENYQKANVAGDKESLKRERENLQSPIKSAANLFNAARKGDMTDGQWANLKELTADNPDAALKQEIESKQFGPRTSDFLQRRVNFDSLKFMAATGDMPDGDLVDMASPSMVQFTQTANEMQSFLKTIDATTGGSMSQVFGIDSLAKKNQILRKLSAEAMIAMLTNPGAATPGSVTTPYAGKPQPQQGAPNAAASPGKPVSKPSIGPTGNRAGYGNPWEDPNAERGGYEQPRSRIPGHQD